MELLYEFIPLLPGENGRLGTVHVPSFLVFFLLKKTKQTPDFKWVL